MMTGGILEIDVHGMNVQEALAAIRLKVRSAGTSVYRIRVIHGYHGGTRIRSAIRDEFYYGMEARVKNVVPGNNQGITELVLRDF